MEDTGTVLLYGFNRERRQEISELCGRCGLSVLCAGPGDAGTRLADFFQEAGEAGKDCRTLQETVSGQEMLVISAQMSTVSHFIELFPKHGIKPVALKAVLTGINADWTLAELQDHLTREHESMMRYLAARRTERGDA